jgi:stalled ribosome alternative rescue factor ArfA
MYRKRDLERQKKKWKGSYMRPEHMDEEEDAVLSSALCKKRKETD